MVQESVCPCAVGFPAAAVRGSTVTAPLVLGCYTGLSVFPSALTGFQGFCGRAHLLPHLSESPFEYHTPPGQRKKYARLVLRGTQAVLPNILGWVPC